jgi:hypothetical protein
VRLAGCRPRSSELLNQGAHVYTSGQGISLCCNCETFAVEPALNAQGWAVCQVGCSLQAVRAHSLTRDVPSVPAAMPLLSLCCCRPSVDAPAPKLLLFCCQEGVLMTQPTDLTAPCGVCVAASTSPRCLSPVVKNTVVTSWWAGRCMVASAAGMVWSLCVDVLFDARGRVRALCPMYTPLGARWLHSFHSCTNIAAG